MYQAYKFSECAGAKKPVTKITLLFEKVMSEQSLNREEKNRIADICYGLSSQHAPCYKLGGWCWDLMMHLTAYVVEFNHGGLGKYYAPDKTSLRRTLTGIRRFWVRSM